MPSDHGYIYALRGADGETRYIGRTKASLSRRLKRHKKNALTGSPRPLNQWLRAEGDDVTIHQLGDPVPLDELAVREQQYIAHEDAKGRLLTNIARGTSKDPDKQSVHVYVKRSKAKALDTALLNAGYKTRTAWLRDAIDYMIEQHGFSVELGEDGAARVEPASPSQT